MRMPLFQRMSVTLRSRLLKEHFRPECGNNSSFQSLGIVSNTVNGSLSKWEFVQSMTVLLLFRVCDCFAAQIMIIVSRLWYLSNSSVHSMAVFI
jgi:hypothetical protein